MFVTIFLGTFLLYIYYLHSSYLFADKNKQHSLGHDTPGRLSLGTFFAYKVILKLTKNVVWLRMKFILNTSKQQLKNLLFFFLFFKGVTKMGSGMVKMGTGMLLEKVFVISFLNKTSNTGRYKAQAGLVLQIRLSKEE